MAATNVQHLINRFRERMTNKQRDVMVAWMLILPTGIILLLVILYPLVQTFLLSMTDASPKHGAVRNFVFLSNYLHYLSDPLFWETIRRTTYFTVLSVVLVLSLGLLAAVWINSKPPGWRFLQISLIIPWAVPTIVNGAIWRWIYNADYGALNGILYQFGLIDKYIPWLISPGRAMDLVIIADIWHMVPFAALIFQAALATHPTELIEAASIDGANSWQRFWFITIPLLRPVILVLLVIRTVEAFRVFDIIYIITRGGPAFGTVTISYLTYLETFRSLEFGRGAALSFLVSLFILAAALVYIRVLHTEDV